MLVVCRAPAQPVTGPEQPLAPSEQPPLLPSEQPPSVLPSAPAPTAAPQPPPPFGPEPGVLPGVVPAVPVQPPSPFEAAPGVFPTITPAPLTPTTPEVVSPFGAAPGVFPTISPAPPATAPAQVPSPFGPAPGLFPGIPSAPAAAAPPELIPQYGYGNPLAPTEGATGLPTTPATPPSTTALPPVTAGAVPVQAGNLRAPPILIVPRISLFEGYTDNPRNRPSTLSDEFTHLTLGNAVSVDSVRLQGQLTDSLDYYKYARATDQDSLTANLAGYGLGTVVPDHVFVQGNATVSELSRAGGVGFANSALIPPSQATQTEVVSVSPFVRESIGGLVDGELRYTSGLTLFQNGSLLGISSTPSTPAPSTSLSNAAMNEASLSLATGSRFTAFGSKLTLDATDVASQSAAKSTQLRGFDDVEYLVNSGFAVLGRVGYESLDYPLQPAASTRGPLWLIGTQLMPFPDDYLVVHYGFQYGFYGADGMARYQVTPSTVVSASYQRNLSSSQQQILTNLQTSQLSPTGVIVNQFTGLPSALTNPEFSYAANAVYRQEMGEISVQTTLGRNTFGVLGVYNHQLPLGPVSGVKGVAATLAGANTSIGANLNWSRSLTPRLASSATLGYDTAAAGSFNTLTADWRLTYTISDYLTAALHYSLINVSSSIATGSYRRDLVEVGVTRSF